MVCIQVGRRGRMSSGKKHLADAIDSLIGAWGGDTPPEAFWVLTDLIKFINKEYGTNFKDMTSEEMSEVNEIRLEVITEWLRS